MPPNDRAEELNDRFTRAFDAFLRLAEDVRASAKATNRLADNVERQLHRLDDVEARQEHTSREWIDDRRKDALAQAGDRTVQAADRAVILERLSVLEKHITGVAPAVDEAVKEEFERQNSSVRDNPMLRDRAQPVSDPPPGPVYIGFFGAKVGLKATWKIMLALLAALGSGLVGGERLHNWLDGHHHEPPAIEGRRGSP